eukprot:gene24674-33145_t
MSVIRETITTDSDRRFLVDISWIPSCAIAIAIMALISSKSNSLELNAKIRAESLGVLIKLFVTAVTVSALRWGVSGFGYAQISYGITYFIAMVCFIPHSKIKLENGESINLRHFFPNFSRLISYSYSRETISLTSQRMLSTSYSAFQSSLFKHVITEADKITLVLLSSSSDQGLYAIASNYGSIVARIAFLPMEDMARIAFAKSTSPIGLAMTASKGGDSRDKLGVLLKSLLQLLVKLLALLSAIGILFPTFGMPYIDVFVRMSLGQKWQSIETVYALQTYCIYIFVLAVNGMSEAFVQSVTPYSSFLRLNIGLLLSSAVFAVVALPAMRYLGTSGVIVANICSMSCRIVFNLVWIQSIFQDPTRLLSEEQKAQLDPKDKWSGTEDCSFASQLVPPLRSLLALALSSVICFSSNAFLYQQSDKRLSDALQHVAVGAVAGLAVLATYISDLSPADREYLKDHLLRRSASGEKKDKEE